MTNDTGKTGFPLRGKDDHFCGMTITSVVVNNLIRSRLVKKKWIILTLALVVVVAGFGLYRKLEKKGGAEYTTASVSRGNLESTITSSGTISPVSQVDVGTQVSGTLAKVFVDFNDHVQKGQLLAVLDTLLLKASVMDAQASLDRATALSDQAQADYARNKPLFDSGVISEAEFLPIQINVKTQQAAVKSARAALTRAEGNLRYAVITAPISGIVIARNVEAGQTVAASFSTPTLFTIAEDLSRMELLIDVDESDIGTIKVGLPIRFSVPAYAERRFKGIITQLRLSPKVVSNVVTYTVVAQADNEDNLLMPGMTATVDFILDHRDDVLMVPSAATRLQPTKSMIEAMRAKRGRDGGAIAGEPGEHRGNGGGWRSNGKAGADSTGTARIWYLDDTGNLAVTRVKTGMTDGTNTELVSAGNLNEGMKIITGAIESSNGGTQKSGTLLGGPPRDGRGMRF